MKNYFKEAMGSVKTVGTIRPSSKYLIRECLHDLALFDAKHILEFGPGDGCITLELATRMNTGTQLYSFETNPRFYSFCTDKFSKMENVHILKKSAFEFDLFLKEVAINKVDYIVSSLPLTLFKKPEVSLLLNKAHQHLKKGGIFVQYQYSLDKYWELKRIFNNVNLDLTVRNLPPAFIYKCYD